MPHSQPLSLPSLMLHIPSKLGLIPAGLGFTNGLGLTIRQMMIIPHLFIFAGELVYREYRFISTTVYMLMLCYCCCMFRMKIGHWIKKTFFLVHNHSIFSNSTINSAEKLTYTKFMCKEKSFRLMRILFELKSYNKFT